MHMLRTLSVVALGTAVLALYPTATSAHCDAMDGPVVQAARHALDRKDVALVLPWVSQERESDVRAAFARTLAVRGLGSEARTLADTWFFETLVRIHREGEGAPFDGLKPAGHIEPFVAAVDRSLSTGSVEDVVAEVSGKVASGIRARFAHAREAQRSAGRNVAAGREYVAAYVEYLHFVERLEQAAAGKTEAHKQP